MKLDRFYDTSWMKIDFMIHHYSKSKNFSLDGKA
jgi:hypothetical protein